MLYAITCLPLLCRATCSVIYFSKVMIDRVPDHPGIGYVVTTRRYCEVLRLHCLQSHQTAIAAMDLVLAHELEEPPFKSSLTLSKTIQGKMFMWETAATTTKATSSRRSDRRPIEAIRKRESHLEDYLPPGNGIDHGNSTMRSTRMHA